MNRVILKGNAGHDPRITNFDGGGKVAEFTLATTRRGYTKEDGTKVEDRTEWHRICVTRKGLAGVVEKFVKKGTPVLLEGELRYRKYTDKNGTEREVAEVYAEELELCGGEKPAASNAPAAPKPEYDDFSFDR